MTFEKTPLDGCYVVHLTPSTDERGWFARTFCKDTFNHQGLVSEWVQINHSFTKQAGSIRGMHYQLPPFREVKYIRCIRGEVWDVVVDLRHNSATFLKTFSIKLSAQVYTALYVPEGFAHGFQTLTDNCELLYHHSRAYEPGFEGGIRYDDPGIAIEWPSVPTVISNRDKSHPLLEDNFKGI